jgi:Glycosyl hydrolases family 39
MKSTRGVVVGLVAVAAAIALVVGTVACGGGSGDEEPVGAVAAVQDDRLAIDAIDALPARLDLIADTGATTTRYDIFWAQVAPRRPADPRDPADPAYDWSRADAVLEGLAERDITPIVSVYNAPAWATGGRYEPPGYQINTAAPDSDDFADFMAALTTRYSGEFLGLRGETLPEVRFVEIWNEPNLQGFFRPQFEDGRPVSLDRYADMVKATYPAMKEANADVQVIAGVGGPRGSTGETGIGAIDWLQGLKEREIPLDGYSQHIYPSAGPEVPTDALPSWSSVGRFLEEIDGFQPGLPFYITEAGYTTAPTPYRDTAVTEDEQAEYLTQIYSLPQLRTDQVKAVVWFNLEDNVNWPAGLYREGLEKKPSYERFVDVVEGQGGARMG